MNQQQMAQFMATLKSPFEGGLDADKIQLFDNYVLVKLVCEEQDETTPKLIIPDSVDTSQMVANKQKEGLPLVYRVLATGPGRFNPQTNELIRKTRVEPGDLVLMSGRASATMVHLKDSHPMLTGICQDTDIVMVYRPEALEKN